MNEQTEIIKIENKQFILKAMPSDKLINLYSHQGRSNTLLNLDEAYVLANQLNEMIRVIGGCNE